MKREVEILAPAGSWECLEAAVCAGADAIYIGGSRFGARAHADNLNEERMLEAIDYVHLHGRKLYMTVNTLLKEQELGELVDYLRPYYEQGLDAVIVQDIGAMRLIREAFPDLPLHVSTQATVTQTLSAQLFQRMGAERIVPARELSLEEIKNMKNATGLEIECFVHGALCYCYSGQCLMSSMIGGRSGNRGECAQPCRLPYRVENRKSADLMSLKDLCTIDMIPELVEAGIDSFKIEGRMKQPDYVYTVTQMYRKYTDIYLQKGKKGFHVTKEDKEKLENCYRRRGYCDGYYRKQNGKEMLSLKRPGKETEPKKEKMDYILQEKIDGTLNLAEGTVSELTVWLHDRPEMTVTVTGDMVQTAKNQPLAAERIEKQIRKTGNTPFVFEEVYIDVSGNLFLPMQSLNELRRAALSDLEVQITEEYRRHMIWSEIQAEDMSDNKFENSRRNYEFQISVETVEQLKLALAREYVDRIFISDAIAFDETVIDMLEEYRLNMRDKKHESKICLAMPYIFRERAMNIYKVYFEKISQYYEGVLVRNWEALEWMKSKGYKGEILSDYNLYGWNNRAIKELSELGIDQYTSSIELNFRELSELSTGGNLIVYGYQPVMITANCIRRTTEDCLGKDSMLYITDRLGNKFPVKNYCKYCYNIIYNSAPIVLLDQKNEIRSLEPSGIRLNFTLEKEREMEQILESYKNVFLEDKEIPMPDISFTRGHFKRGVK